MPHFTPPGVLEPTAARTRLHVGVSLLRVGGHFRQVRCPSAEEIESSDRTYLGGRVYEITDDEAAELASAGYGEWVTP